VSLRVDYDERSIGQATAFLDDPPGIRAALDAIDQLADDPRPDGSFPYGSPDLRRLRIDRYRVLYEISDDAIAIRHIARASLQMACGHASWRRVSTASRLVDHEPSLRAYMSGNWQLEKWRYSAIDLYRRDPDPHRGPGRLRHGPGGLE
jgi:mRNA interferase RelE/StbE